MDDAHALPSQVLEALARGAIILTANQRAARTLRHGFDLDRRARGLAFWEPPAILAWDTWMDGLWSRLLLEGHTSELLLNSAQEHTLWRAIVAADPAMSSLRPIDSLCETAAGAWLLLHAYRGRRRLHSVPGNNDTRAFERWAGEFEGRCTHDRFLTQAQLPETLRSAIADGRLDLPSKLLLVGFDSKTPAQDALLDAVRAAGAAIDEMEQGPQAAETILTGATDDNAELSACAGWLRARLTNQPDAHIAVIVSDIEAGRSEIDRVFRGILAPELNDIAAPIGSSPYEFSLGVPLAATAIVTTALDILRWALGPLPLDRVCALLLSPHFAAGDAGAGAAGSASELLARAEFDAFVLRDKTLLQPQIELEALFTLALRSKLRPDLSTLLNHLRELAAILRQQDLAAHRTHAEWAAAFHQLLDAAGWAARTRDNSVEFQTRRKWEDALDQLATLDFEDRRVSFRSALATLERVASETLFAPESRHAPVQIMGPLESAGSAFDAIWFLRAGDLSWPPTPSPNPLLPWLLQRELAMPGADPARDTAHARRITDRIAAGAPTLVFSYAQQSADSRQRPSPLLRGLGLEHRAASEIAPAGPPPAIIALEASADDTPIPPPPDRVLFGGAGILQSQAACGFRAFAEKRLFASTPEAATLGLDSRERGSLVHRVLELFWTEVRTQDALRQMPPPQRDALLARSIETALDKETRRVDPGWPHAYLATERRRLLRLLNTWLDLELTRTPFAVRATEEQMHDAIIGPLHIDVRVDRIDTSLRNGEPAGDIILDYKTGNVSPAEWLGDRPDEPQLPLYAVLSSPASIAAVAFANVRPGEDQPLTGYESRKGVLAKPKPLKTESLDAQIESWRNVLSALAESFHAGDARVEPKQYPSTCRYCQQRLLCRLDLSKLAPDANEDFVDAADLAAESLESPTEVESG